MEVHAAAESGFGSSSDAYERGRPSYPMETLSWLAGELGIAAGARVVDLAAGTGKFTRLLTTTGASVIAVEPVDAMRHQLVRNVATVDVRAGTAEAIPVEESSVDAVTVAQAFHWFDAPRAVAELARVLQPEGGVVLVWNRRLLDDPLQAALEEIVARYRGDTPSHRSSRWREAFEAEARFGPFVDHEVGHAQRVDVDGLVDRVLSTSFIAASPVAVRSHVANEVAALPAQLGLGDHFPLVYRTEAHLARRR